MFNRSRDKGALFFSTVFFILLLKNSFFFALTFLLLSVSLHSLFVVMLYI